MLLLFLDKQVDALLVNSTPSPRRLFSQMQTLPAFADLKTLQRPYERLSQAGFNMRPALPRNRAAMRAIPLEVIQPMLDHNLSLSHFTLYFVPQSK
jgi:fermentation-respiration switch protein FrsA (DUF1100 family)